MIIPSRVQPWSASSGICSMNRSSNPCSTAQARSPGASASLMPRISTALILISPSPTACRFFDAGEDPVQERAAGELREGTRMQRVQGNVDPGEPGSLERGGLFVQAQPVSGQGDRKVRMVGPDPGNDVHQVCPNQRLSAGQPQLPDAQGIDADPHQPDDFRSGKDLVLGQPVQAGRPACSRCSAGCTYPSGTGACQWRGVRSGQRARPAAPERLRPPGHRFPPRQTAAV